MLTIKAFRGEDECVTLATVDGATLTAGGYRTGAYATLRDGNGDEIAYLWGAEGWVDTADGKAWADIVIVAGED